MTPEVEKSRQLRRNGRLAEPGVEEHEHGEEPEQNDNHCEKDPGEEEEHHGEQEKQVPEGDRERSGPAGGWGRGKQDQAWVGADMTIVVRFDPAGEVEFVLFPESIPDRWPPLSEFRRWPGL